MTTEEHYYRFYDRHVHLEGSEPITHVYLQVFTVLRRTPRGAWIGYGTSKWFVLDGARRRYAYPTQELAMDSFQARKHWQQAHLERQLHASRRALQASREIVLPIKDAREHNLSTCYSEHQFLGGPPVHVDT